MINWEIVERRYHGGRDARADMADLVEKGLEACWLSRGSALYLEMWPDSGRWVCYPADPPEEGQLAEQRGEFLAQVVFRFWRPAWLGIPFEAEDSEAKYRELREEALRALVEVFQESASRRVEWGGVTLYAFEFEGTEGVAVVTKDEVGRL